MASHVHSSLREGVGTRRIDGDRRMSVCWPLQRISLAAGNAPRWGRSDKSVNARNRHCTSTHVSNYRSLSRSGARLLIDLDGPLVVRSEGPRA